MTRDEARGTIRANWRQHIGNLLPLAKKKANGEPSYICPLCEHGDGGDGLTFIKNPKTAAGRDTLSCPACGWTGDIFDLYQIVNGGDYDMALQALAAEEGITLDKWTGRQDARQHPTTTGSHKATEAPAADNLPVNAPEARENGSQGATGGITEQLRHMFEERDDAEGRGPAVDYSEYYRERAAALPGSAAERYAKERGIDSDILARFNIGYDAAWISPTAVERLEAEGKTWRPDPSERIIFPVEKNHYVARAINADQVAPEYAKVNETGHGRAGIFNASEALKGDAAAVFIVEGVFDALSIYQAMKGQDVENAEAVALNSTSNVRLFLEKAKDAGKSIQGTTFIICMDSDKAGQEAAGKLERGLKELELECARVDDLACGKKDANAALISDVILGQQIFSRKVNDTIRRAAMPDNAADYIAELMPAEIRELENAIHTPTGFSNLDQQTGGIYPGLYCIAAASSLGKSTFALQLADNLAERGQHVLFFSLEMSRLEMISKSLSRYLAVYEDKAVSALALRMGKYPELLKAAAGHYLEKTGGRVSIIEGNFDTSVEKIRQYVRAYRKATGHTPVVFIDYLQVLRAPEDVRKQSTKEQIDRMVVSLKLLSRELKAAVIAISSINRANYLQPIDFEALKESGAIEYTADSVWGLQLACLSLDDLFNSPNKIKEKRAKIRKEKSRLPRNIEFVCLKNRGGNPTFSCFFRYFANCDLFEVDNLDVSSLTLEPIRKEDAAFTEATETTPFETE